MGDTSIDDSQNASIDVEDYNPEEGKLVASLKWLITRIYEDKGIPDKLRELFYRDEEGNLCLTEAVASALTHGSLYAQAASRILRDPSLVNETHGNVLRALSRAVEIEVRDSDGSIVTEHALLSTNPIKMTTHLALIDALMTAHMKAIISIDRVVQVVSDYATVDKSEEPIDCVDALIFWINKICFLVRDDLERADLPMHRDSGQFPTIPEMEDLYEEICDGTCICALVSFYRSHELNILDVCLNDPPSLPDCRYNLERLKQFCETCLPWNPFHFEIEDILYLHESLQPNVNAFLADLFQFFEPASEPPPQVPSPTQRRFVPVQAIPDLRAQNLAARPVHPPKVRGGVPTNRDRTQSVSSQDSLMTAKSGEPRNAYRPSTLPPGAATMSFGALASGNLISPTNDIEKGSTMGKDPASLAAVRLAMHQRRQEYEQKQYMESTASEVERQKAGKDAFFKLMKQDSASRSRAMSEMGGGGVGGPSGSPHRAPMDGFEAVGGSLQQTPVHQGLPVHPATAREEMLSAQVQSLQEQIQNMAMNGGMSHAISQPSLQAEMMYANQMYPQRSPNETLPMYANPYGAYAPPPPPPIPPHHQSPGGPYGYQHHPSNYGYPPHASPMRYPNTPSHHSNMSVSMYDQHYSPMPPTPNHHMYAHNPYEDAGSVYGDVPPGVPNANTFHLHQAHAATSRLDPPLEISRNLTNWGLTYKASTTTRPKRSWTNFRSEHDIRNHPDVVPTSEGGQSQEDEPTNGSTVPPPTAFEIAPPVPTQNHHSSPPRDPDLRKSESSLTVAANQATPIKRSVTTLNGNGAGDAKAPAAPVLIKDGDNGETPEMRAKREALYANLMKRKAEIPHNVEEKEAILAGRRMKELEKQELAEQRKLEKEERRQRVLEEYKRKKLEKEFPDMATSSSSGTPISSARSTSNLQRGHSQPPFVQHTKSVSNMPNSASRTLQRPSRAKSNAACDENTTPRVPSTAEPTLKLFAKHVPKSNRSLIVNALQFAIFPGAVSAEQRNKVQEALAGSDSKHFLMLFRDVKCQYRGLYTWDGVSDTARWVHGTGPKVIREDMMNMMFKYDSGNKKFSQIPSKHLSPTIDGFTIQDQFWMRPKIPHSRPR
uniref:Calponin-homology (CH) domain-containing protein n=1 Tax=Panagrellus redivivus TaxID=6233 RepID=A0A7E4V3R2_PANRE